VSKEPPNVVGLSQGKMTGFPFTFQVNRDGTVAFTAHMPGPRTLTWTGTAQQARDLGSAATTAGANAGRWVGHLRGDDRYVFAREGTVYSVRYYGEARDLCAYVVGQIKRAHRCSSCRASLAKGDRAYKAVRFGGRVTWSQVRLCAGCVEAAPAARAYGPLRAIDGGKGKPKDGAA
jgi:hypothetical protein